MTLRPVRSFVLFVAAAGITGTTAAPVAAQSQATGTNTVSSSLQVNVTVAKAVRLTLATDTDCVISAGSAPPDFTMDFGTVDALGISTSDCGTTLAPATPGVTPAAYAGSYTLTPLFTGQGTTNNTISAYVSTNFSATAAGLLTVVQGSSSPSSPADLAAMSTLVGSQTTVASNVASGTALTRYVGVSVAPMNGPGALTGADTATITYTLTVQ